MTIANRLLLLFVKCGRPREHEILLYCKTESTYRMIYWGPSFLAVLWFGSTPTPHPPLPSASYLSFSVFLCVAGRAHWPERGEGVHGRAAKSYEREKACSSINHSLGTLCFTLANNFMFRGAATVVKRSKTPTFDEQLQQSFRKNKINPAVLC